MENIIQQLKDNEKPFGLMSQEMQDKARAIGVVNNFRVYRHTAGNEQIWHSVRSDESCSGTNDFFVYGTTYRLRADYEDEPEIVECEIQREIFTPTACGRLAIIKPNHQRVLLSEVCNEPDFIGFKFESGQVEFSPIVFKSSCSTKSICQFRDLADLEVLHATHVLFRQKRQE